eukprot:1707674-Rhodomonas_salina.5
MAWSGVDLANAPFPHGGGVHGGVHAMLRIPAQGPKFSCCDVTFCSQLHFAHGYDDFEGNAYFKSSGIPAQALG